MPEISDTGILNNGQENSLKFLEKNNQGSHLIIVGGLNLDFTYSAQKMELHTNLVSNA